MAILDDSITVLLFLLHCILPCAVLRLYYRYFWICSWRHLWICASFVNQTIEDLECILLYIIRPKLLVPRGTTFSCFARLILPSAHFIFSSFFHYSRVLQEIDRASELQGLCGEQTWWLLCSCLLVMWCIFDILLMEKKLRYHSFYALYVVVENST